jgi:hypothetical protein
MTRELLRDLDPVRTDDPFLDPDGATARAVLAAARTRPGGATRPPRRRGRLAAGATAALAAAAVVALVAGGGSHALSAQAAMVRAAERTATAKSGVIVWHLDANGHATRREETRIHFDGDNVSAARIRQDSGGSVTTSEVRFVAGNLYVGHGDRWRRLYTIGTVVGIDFGTLMSDRAFVRPRVDYAGMGQPQAITAPRVVTR